MTFGNFIFQLRTRLQDLRDSTGTAVIDINSNGIRWSASELMEIANMASTQIVRLSRIYPKSPAFMYLSDNAFVTNESITMTSGVGSLPTNSLDIIGLASSVTQTLAQAIYVRIPPRKYQDYLNEVDSERYDEHYFTVMMDITEGVRKIYTLPNTITETMNATVLYAKTNYDATDVNTEMFIQGMDDLLLDIAERECRDREHNWERSKILDARISVKLGLIGGNR